MKTELLAERWLAEFGERPVTQDEVRAFCDAALGKNRPGIMITLADLRPHGVRRVYGMPVQVWRMHVRKPRERAGPKRTVIFQAQPELVEAAVASLQPGQTLSGLMRDLLRAHLAR